MALGEYLQGGVDAGGGTIEHDALVAALGGGAITLVDVLPPASYSAGHIPGALSLPIGELPARAGDVLPGLGAPIVVYCGGYT